MAESPRRPVSPLRSAEPIFASAAMDYLEARFAYPLPLPPRRKSPPPRGYTGADAKAVTPAKAREWCRRRRANSNVCLRLRDGFLGIDVDAYDGKRGADTLARSLEHYGPLPATVMSSSRDDGISGIYLFRVPLGGRWASELKALQPDGRVTSDVQLVHAGCRYMVCWPSRHPEQRQYAWRAPNGDQLQGIPRIEDLADLPASWLSAVTKNDEPNVRAPAANITNKPPYQPSGLTPSTDRRLAREVAKVLQAPPGSRNQTLNRSAFTLSGHSDISDIAIKEALRPAAIEAGLGGQEVDSTLSSAIEAGRLRPFKP